MLHEVVAPICRLHCGGRCAVGSGGKSVGYLAHGTATDYMYDVAGVPMSFTWEIFGDLNAAFADCFKMFNPIDGAAVEATVSNWASAVITLVELLPNHPDIAAMNFEPIIKVPGKASNQTAVTTPRMISESGEPAPTASAGPKDQTRDHSVHGGRDDAVLEHSDTQKGSEPQHLGEDEGVHEHAAAGHFFLAKEMSTMLRLLYILPVLVLILLAILLKTARKGRTPWSRVRERVV